MQDPIWTKFDLAIAWTWEYDQEFVELLQRISHASGFTTYFVHPGNIEYVYRSVTENKLFFRVFLDRASDVDERFGPLAKFAMRSEIENDPHHRIAVINPYDLSHRAADKATMHLEFLTNNIRVPYTIIISPYRLTPEPDLTHEQLRPIGKPFIIKPANTTGGGVGVILDGQSLHDVLEARRSYIDDKYLLQECIRPVKFGERKAWFRVFYAFGRVFPCWWDDESHIYHSVTEADEEAFGLEELRKIAVQIHTVCRLHFFSTEIAYTSRNGFIVVDYVNEMCDMRLKSNHPDGVPDDTVEEIISAMLGYVKRERNRMLPMERAGGNGTV